MCAHRALSGAGGERWVLAGVGGRVVLSSLLGQNKGRRLGCRCNDEDQRCFSPGTWRDGSDGHFK